MIYIADTHFQSSFIFLFYLVTFEIETNTGMQKWKRMLEIIGDGTRANPKKERVFYTLAGDVTPFKITLANALTVDWQIKYQM